MKSIDETFWDLKILKITEMIQIELAKFGFDISRSVQPKPVQNMMESRGGKKLHRYPTQSKNTPNIQCHKSETFNRSFQCKSIVEFNGLFSELKNSKSAKHLVKVIKKHLQET